MNDLSKIIKREDIDQGCQGIWRTSKYSVEVHAYGVSDVKDIITRNPDDFIEIIIGLVKKDFIYKVTKMMDEEKYLPTSALFNYGRFYDRYVVKCDVSCFKDCKKIAYIAGSDLWDDEIKNNPYKDTILQWFAHGEFPFIDVYLIESCRGISVCYIISR